MDKIEIKVLNPQAVQDAEKLLVATARITQHAENITCMDDLLMLLDKPYSSHLLEALIELPHPTLQKFGVINIAVVGASRRFLAQITRHQNEVKFMSGSLQYSDYTDKAQFVVPYEIIVKDKESPAVKDDTGYTDYYRWSYIKSCQQAYAEYEAAIKHGINHDAAAYMMPQGLRNVLLISATPYQWKHMISQRICNRNTLETQYVMLRCWEELDKLGTMFDNIGPSCMHGCCNERRLSCHNPLLNTELLNYRQLHSYSIPTALLNTHFKYIRKENNNG